MSGAAPNAEGGSYDPAPNDMRLHPAAPVNGDEDLLEQKKTSQNLTGVRGALGLHPLAPIHEAHDEAEHQDLWWSRVKLILREPFAEFFGVFILVLFGDGSVAQVQLSAGQTTAPGGDGFGSYQSISWGWGLGVMLGIYVAGDSGAYLNPAITFASCYYRQLPWRRFPMYFMAQFLGGFAAAAVVYGMAHFLVADTKDTDMIKRTTSMQ